MKFRKFLILTGKKFSAAYQAFLAAVGADGGTVEAKAYTDALLQTASNASIVQIPSAYKAAVLYNQVPTPTGQDFTVARASDVWRVNPIGILEVANAGYGDDVVTGWDFTSGWTLGATVVVTNATTFSNVTGVRGLKKDYLTVGKTYKMHVIGTSDVLVSVYNGTAGVLYKSLGTGAFDETFQFTATIDGFINILNLQANGTTTVTSMVVEQLITFDVPCIDYSDGFPVLLTQPQSTNLVTYSEDFSDVYWTVASSNITTVFGQSSPDGTLNATRITATAGSPSRLRGQSTITSGVSTTVSLYIKRVSGSGIVSLFNVNGVGSVSLPITNEWERYSVSAVSTSTTGRFILDIATDDDIIDVWGTQLEELSYPTSYIPTSGATATRLGDLVTGAGSTSSINSEEGVLYLEIAALANSGAYRVVSLTSGIITQRIFIGYAPSNNQIQFYMQTTSGNQVSILHTLSNALDYNEIAIKWKTNDAGLYVNGVEVATDVSVITDAANTYGKLNFTDYNGTSSYFYGKTKQLRVYSSIADAQIDLPYIT